MKRSSTRRSTFAVTTDAAGIVNHAGAAALRELAQRGGYTSTLTAGLEHLGRERTRHDPGSVLTDLMVSIADGGDCLSDLRVLRDQPQLFGPVASVPTISRLISEMTEDDLLCLREARRRLRERAWSGAEKPELVVLDIDATLVTAHSRKERASGTFKRGFGFHPLLCFLDLPGLSGESLAGLLRPGSAGSNTAADHINVFEMASEQLPSAFTGAKVLVRCDSGGCSHDFLKAVRKAREEGRQNTRFSVGYELRDEVRRAIAEMPEEEWEASIGQEGMTREDAHVCELTSRLDLSRWPSGSRVLCRRERILPGSQLRLSDHRGWRFQVMLTDQEDADITVLDARHRARARCEDAIRCAKETGLRGFPFQGFIQNQVWLELVLAAHDLLCHFRRIGLRGPAQLWEPKTLRYRLLHTAGRMVERGRRLTLRLQRAWPWSRPLADAFVHLRAVSSG